MITLDKLRMEQGDFSLGEIDLTIPTGEYAILMGPTGAGKTTLLETICGLRRISGGKIWLDGQDVTHCSPAKRQIGYVPQDAVLFPTMRIDQQIGFPLEVRRVKDSQRRERVQQLAGLLEIESLLDRYPRGLSGGEKQRVALARALSFRPRLLCLDEPLSAIDSSTRGRLSELLREIHRQEPVTVLHITHNAAEANELATMRFQIDAGKIC